MQEFALDVVQKLGEEEMESLLPHLHSEEVTKDSLLQTSFSELRTTALQISPSLMWLLQAWATSKRQCDRNTKKQPTWVVMISQQHITLC